MVNPAILLAIALLPALGAFINGGRAFATPLGTKNRAVTNVVALGTTGLSALLAVWTVLGYRGATAAFEHVYYSWIPAGLGRVWGNGLADFAIKFAFRIDPLSCTMLLIVTIIGFLIHIYATGYMSHEEGYTRFFTYLNLFMFAMLTLVLGANYVVLFVGWEGVGLCSYLLIGFWFDRQSATNAGMKAFVVNRVGDAGFALGMFLIFTTFGSLDFRTVMAQAAEMPVEWAWGGTLTVIALCLFVGATGK